MPTWQNWSGRLSSKPEQLSFIYTEEQAAALALACKKAGQSLRAVERDLKEIANFDDHMLHRLKHFCTGAR